jgi:hypothetical protein
VLVSHNQRMQTLVVCKCSVGTDSFTSNNLELVRVQRGPGLNDVGMVAWHMTLKTPECQQGRQVSNSRGTISHLLAAQLCSHHGPLARGSGAPPLCTGTMLDCREAGKAR